MCNWLPMTNLSWTHNNFSFWSPKNEGKCNIHSPFDAYVKIDNKPLQSCLVSLFLTNYSLCLERLQFMTFMIFIHRLTFVKVCVCPSLSDVSEPEDEGMNFLPKSSCLWDFSYSSFLWLYLEWSICLHLWRDNKYHEITFDESCVRKSLLQT